ncbi:MAG: hypothetical protein AMJ93_09370, partial [Anaerolineae bacterium SM23_84]
MTCTLTLVSHTHWDREWYQPFQEYRVRLIQLVDRLLDLLARDPRFRCFTLDGQTIILEDYLDVRPDAERRLKNLIQEGRLLVGPWYVLPDEFLISPEAMIRNLMLGDRTARRFGDKMAVGYVPDSFGHVSQLPQILRGFGMDTAVLWRGVGEAPNEFRWVAPDGSDVLVVYLRDGYCNAAHLPEGREAFAARLTAIAKTLATHTTTSHLLAMNGTDHLEAVAEIPQLIALADRCVPDLNVHHGSLPEFIAGIRAEEPDLEVRAGEMRSPQRAHLLPGVFSTRMWIKQRNHHCEMLLEKWAEPFSAVARAYGLRTPTGDLQALIWQAWRYLMQNQAHDSICGCGADVVHKEMDVRFDWVEQIGEEITRQSLAAIAEAVDTSSLTGSPLMVFNPTSYPRTDLVTVRVSLPMEVEAVEAVGPEGERQPCEITRREHFETEVVDLDAGRFLDAISWATWGTVDGQGVQAVETSLRGEMAVVDLVLSSLPPRVEVVEWGRSAIETLLADEGIRHWRLQLHRFVELDVRFVASGVPGHGYKTYALRPVLRSAESEVPAPLPCLENEYFLVEADPNSGLLTVIDKATGAVLPQLHRFVDGGDRGDEYNYCPPENDRLITAPGAHLCVRGFRSSPVRQTLEISQVYMVPAGLTGDRAYRSDELTPLPITSRVSLSPGVPRIDFVTTVQNCAKDHRLRVHFPVPIITDLSYAEGHFDVLARSLELPANTENWPEQPVATQHQRTFVDVNDGLIGLLVANRGLPEYEVISG